MYQNRQVVLFNTLPFFGAAWQRKYSRRHSASVGAAIARVITLGNHLIGDGRKAIAAFARRAGILIAPRNASSLGLLEFSVVSLHDLGHWD
jgi:hypothetical protein